MSDMHELLREGFARYARDSYGFERRRACEAAPEAYLTEAWNDYAALGWLALRLPEEHGGLDADAAAVGALMETVGRHLLMEPLLASAVLGGGALLRGGAPLLAELGPRLAEGSLRLALAHQGGTVRVERGRAHGGKCGVLHGDVADAYIVTAEEAGPGAALFLVEAGAAGLARRPYRLVDGRGAAALDFDGAAARRIGDADAAGRLLDEGTAALCAEALGCADALLRGTVEYLKVRKQFGKPLAAHQALQHRASEMYLLREEIRSLTAAAQRALDAPAPQRARSLSGAAAYVIGAARTIANGAVQLHGGVGVTEELEISHHFRRLMVNAALLGGRDFHLARFASSCLERSAAGEHA
jgi:alkylation response protein AidB-like acyl-CoA dehydrogenase